jgi:hypothetical protein
MGKINYGRVVLGGVVAGIVAAILDWLFHGVLLGQLYANAMKTLNHLGVSSVLAFWVYLFLLDIMAGIVAVWMYAAMRPRIGASMQTAVCAGLVAWFFGGLMPNTIMMLMGFYGRRLTLYATLSGIVVSVVATVAGAALYKEAESTAAYPAAAPQATR